MSLIYDSHFHKTLCNCLLVQCHSCPLTSCTATKYNSPISPATVISVPDLQRLYMPCAKSHVHLPLHLYLYLYLKSIDPYWLPKPSDIEHVTYAYISSKHRTSHLTTTVIKETISIHNSVI
jgi:hypothetical protein